MSYIREMVTIIVLPDTFQKIMPSRLCWYLPFLFEVTAYTLIQLSNAHTA